MKKTSLPLLTLAFAWLAAPAFATHPQELCKINVDTAALAKSKGAEPGPVSVRYIFSVFMTDMYPSEPKVTPAPADNPSLYRAEVFSCPYYRTLSSVRIESVAKKADGTPAWSATFERPQNDAAPAKDGATPPVSCETWAD
jgi:hypothetical protein